MKLPGVAIVRLLSILGLRAAQASGSTIPVTELLGQQWSGGVIDMPLT